MNDRTCDFAFIFCRSGQGVNISANKIKGIRSALIYDPETLETTIRHNAPNFFAFPSKFYSDVGSSEQEAQILDMIDILSKNTFDGGRHQNRVQQIIALEEQA